MRSVNALAAETHAFTPACIRMSSPHASISKKNSRHQPRGPQEPHNRRHPAPPKTRTGAQAPPRTAATPPAARSRTLAPSAGAHAPRGLLHAAAASRRRASPRRRRSHTSSHWSGVARGTHALRRLAMPAAPSAPPPPARSLARAKGDVLAPLCHRRAPAAGSAARRPVACINARIRTKNRKCSTKSSTKMLHNRSQIGGLRSLEKNAFTASNHTFFIQCPSSRLV